MLFYACLSKQDVVQYISPVRISEETFLIHSRTLKPASGFIYFCLFCMSSSSCASSFICRAVPAQKPPKLDFDLFFHTTFVEINAQADGLHFVLPT